MSPMLFNVYVDAIMKEVKMGMRRMGFTFMDEGREWRLPGLSYADSLGLCGASEEDLRDMVGVLVEVFRRRGLTGNACKSKVLKEEEGLECEVTVNWMRLEHVSKFKYLG